MVGIGVAMLALGWLGAFAVWRRGMTGGLVNRAFVAMTFSGWVAVLAGWYTTEIGRQPYLVTGVLRTADAVGPVSGAAVATTLLGYLVVYAVLIAAYVSVVFYLARQAANPEVKDSAPTAHGPRPRGLTEVAGNA